MMPTSRFTVLAAIAEAAGRTSDAGFAENLEAGVTTLTAPGRPPLRLLEGDILDSPGVWLYDEQPAVPPETVPVWRGYLVHVAGDGHAEVVRMGDRLELADAWPALAQLLSTFELASLIARYFGRDAGLPVHHSVVGDRRAAERLLSDPGDLPEKVGRPRLSEPRADDGLVTLSFFTSFTEPDDDGAPSIGYAYWKARWAPEVRLAWDSLVIVRYLRSWLQK